MLDLVLNDLRREVLQAMIVKTAITEEVGRLCGDLTREERKVRHVTSPKGTQGC